ncbi:MAG: substrate-binding domain-containing protein, partial [Vicinamibacterales bacterium]
ALVGVGDIALGDMLKVPLTTVSWSRADLGRQAAELLLTPGQENGGAPTRRVIIPPHLVIRESCGGQAIAARG